MEATINQAKQNLTTIRSWVRFLATEFERHGLFYGHGTDNAVDEAIALVFQAIHLPVHGDKRLMGATLLNEEINKISDWAIRRILKREPLPYITEVAYQGPLSFIVNKNVLIPRSPVAEWLKTVSESENFFPNRILDLCTGSGCLALLAAYYFPDSTVLGGDISQDALDVAQKNLSRHHAEKQVTFKRSDLFADLNQSEKFDLIISNPPYVDADDLNALPAEYRFEPQLALEAGRDGLDVVRRILSEAPKHLNDDGLLVVEVGNSHTALERAFPSLPFTWLEFEHGGHGVFLISKEALTHGR